MPLKLIPPRAGMSHNWRVRGSHLGVAVDQSAKTSDRRLAAKEMARVKEDIEAGRFAPKGAPTFTDAVKAYLEAGGSRRFVKPLLVHFKTAPLSAIDQAAIDHAASTLYPNVSAATRNRQVYTPVSAILRSAGVKMLLTRPKGSGGVRRIAYLEPREAFALIKAATDQDLRFGALLTFLLYTGARLGEALALKCRHVDLSRAAALIFQTKTDGVRTAFLPEPIVAALTALPRGMDRGEMRVFGWRHSGKHYDMLEKAAKGASVVIPDGVAFHIFRHTWATWMRRYAGLDTAGLVETGAWRSRKSASIYEHLDATEESRKAARLPTAAGLRVV